MPSCAHLVFVFEVVCPLLRVEEEHDLLVVLQVPVPICILSQSHQIHNRIPTHEPPYQGGHKELALCPSLLSKNWQAQASVKVADRELGHALVGPGELEGQRRRAAVELTCKAAGMLELRRDKATLGEICHLHTRGWADTCAYTQRRRDTDRKKRGNGASV